MERLDDGIRTYTWSDDPALAAVLVSHVGGMLSRVAEGRDPQVFIQSPTLDILFARRDTITTEVELTDTGVWVTQTSTDPEVVAALQLHADEGSDMAARGMQAVHEMTEAAERMIEMERTLWRLRAEIASRVTPQDLEEEYASRQAMEPIPLEWCLPDGTPVTAADAMHDPFGMGGGGRGAGD